MSVVFLSATGTDVGKTHFAEAFVRAARRPLAVWKPYESGIGLGPSDSERLAAAVRARADDQVRFVPPLGRFVAPLAPPLAARAEGARLDSADFAAALASLSGEVLVELAGGLFAPLTETWLGVDAVLATPGASVILIAPNRLGVLHDVIATVRAAAGVRFDRVVLSEVEHPDASSATNAETLRNWIDVPVTTLRRAPAAELATEL